MKYTYMLNRALDLYKKGNYEEAYDLVTESMDIKNGNAAMLFNFRYSVAARAGKTELALSIFRESIQSGYWYSSDYLKSDTDLDSLRPYAEFSEMVEICREREIAARMSARPASKIIAPSEVRDECPVLVVLHGNSQNIPITEEYWRCEATSHCLLMLLQSSQIDSTDAFTWSDYPKGSNELKKHCEDLFRDRKVDRGRIIPGGFSAGARTALYSALNGMIDATGLILVGPWLPEVEEWAPLLSNLRAKGTRVQVVCGDRDDDCYESAKKLVGMLEERTIPVRYREVSGLDHDYPEDFGESLGEIISFLTERDLPRPATTP